MGKGKKSGKQPVKTPVKPCTCLLLRGEKATSIVEYMGNLAIDTMVVEPPPGEAPTVQLVEGMLIDTAKEVLFKTIHMAFRELDRSICFKVLHESNIVVTVDGLIKIREDNTVDAWDSKVEENIHQLGDVVERLVVGSSKRFMMDQTNAELKHLIVLLRNYKFKKSTFLIKYPPALVPLSNRSFYYLTMSDHILHIVRWNDANVFNMIMVNLYIPKNWYSRLATNSHVKQFLDRGTYDPTCTKKSTVPDIEPLRCLRNLPSHSREGAASGHIKNLIACSNATAPFTFSNEDLSRAIYSKVPMAMCSMAKSLDFVGQLRKLGLENLFPGRLQVLEDES